MTANDVCACDAQLQPHPRMSRVCPPRIDQTTQIGRYRGVDISAGLIAQVGWPKVRAEIDRRIDRG